MSKLIEKVIYRGLSSAHSGGHAQSEDGQAGPAAATGDADRVEEEEDFDQILTLMVKENTAVHATVGGISAS